MQETLYTELRTANMSAGPGAGDFEFEWDDAAEAQFVAIEAAYASSKRSASHLTADDSSVSVTQRRRLPGWAASRQYDSTGAGGESRLNKEASWVIAPSPCRVNLKVHYPAMKFPGEIIYCRSSLEVEKYSKELLDKIEAVKNSGQISLGFDIEWKPVFGRGEPLGKAAVMQICMDARRCYVMHIFHSGISSTLKSLLEDYSSVKVGVFIDNDARKISLDYNVSVQPLMDLSALANIKFGGPPKNWSLSALTETVTCKELLKPKKIRLGNWEADVLSKEQLQYAATDAYVSWYLYQALLALPDPTVEAKNTTEVASAPAAHSS